MSVERVSYSRMSAFATSAVSPFSLCYKWICKTHIRTSLMLSVQPILMIQTLVEMMKTKKTFKVAPKGEIIVKRTANRILVEVRPDFRKPNSKI